MVKKIFYGIAAVIVVASLALSGYYYMKYQASQKLLKDPTLVSKQETASVVAKVSMLMELPTNEEPTLATVKDVTKLKTQEFFAKAKNGDKMLIYTGKKEIILYRPSTNKIINVAPISINNNASPTPAAKVTGEQSTPTSAPTLIPTQANSPTPSISPTQ